MRVLIVSDTHGRLDHFEEILENEDPFDLCVHCGDFEGQEDIIYEMTGPECACVMVPGNNDYLSNLPREKTIKIGKLTAWITHGHNYYVSMDPAIIGEEAQSRYVDIVMFGHTHKPLIQFMGGVLLINPGSLTYPRQEGRRPSYVVLEIDGREILDAHIEYM